MTYNVLMETLNPTHSLTIQTELMYNSSGCRRIILSTRRVHADRRVQTLSAKTAGRSIPSSLAAQARPSRCRSQPSPTVASRRSRFCRSTASRSRRSRRCRSLDSSVIARTHWIDCFVTGFMFSVRPSPNNLPRKYRTTSFIDIGSLFVNSQEEEEDSTKKTGESRRVRKVRRQKKVKRKMSHRQLKVHCV